MLCKRLLTRIPVKAGCIGSLSWNGQVRVKFLWDYPSFISSQCFVDPISNFSHYRQALEASISQADQPQERGWVIPFFSLIVKDIHFMHKGMANKYVQSIHCSILWYTDLYCVWSQYAVVYWVCSQYTAVVYWVKCVYDHIQVAKRVYQVWQVYVSGSTGHTDSGLQGHSGESHGHHAWIVGTKKQTSLYTPLVSMCTAAIPKSSLHTQLPHDHPSAHRRWWDINNYRSVNMKFQQELRLGQWQQNYHPGSALLQAS